MREVQSLTAPLQLHPQLLVLVPIKPHVRSRLLLRVEILDERERLHVSHVDEDEAIDDFVYPFSVCESTVSKVYCKVQVAGCSSIPL